MKIVVRQSFNDCNGNYIETGFSGNIISSRDETLKIKWDNGEISELLDRHINNVDVCDVNIDEDFNIFSSILKSTPKVVVKKILANENKEINELIEDLYFDFSEKNLKYLYSSLFGKEPIVADDKSEYEDKSIEELERSLKIMAGQYVRNRGIVESTQEVVDSINRLVNLVIERLGLPAVKKALQKQETKMKDIIELLDKQEALNEETGAYHEKLQKISKRVTEGKERLKSPAKLQKVIDKLIEKYGETNEVLQDFKNEAYEMTETTTTYIVKMMPGWKDELEPLMSPSEIVKNIEKIISEDNLTSSSLYKNADILGIFSTIRKIWNGIKQIFANIIDKFINLFSKKQEDLEDTLSELDEAIEQAI